MDLTSYLQRIHVTSTPGRADLGTLASIMEAHSRAIAFENCDVVMRQQVSIARSDIEAKLVFGGRGGYCFEQNTLLQMALEGLGFSVTPLLCRVRWNKPDDTAGPNTAFTHLALKVTLAQGEYLADVGFAGTNSIAPVALGSEEPQSLPEGHFRVVDGREGYRVLELLVREEWRALYTWRDEAAALVDLECANWFSCTHPKARFTTSFFVCRVVADERHHILNDEYVVRKGHGVESTVEKVAVRDLEHLCRLLFNVFGIGFDAGMRLDDLDRFLK